MAAPKSTRSRRQRKKLDSAEIAKQVMNSIEEENENLKRQLEAEVEAYEQSSAANQNGELEQSANSLDNLTVETEENNIVMEDINMAKSLGSDFDEDLKVEEQTEVDGQVQESTAGDDLLNNDLEDLTIEDDVMDSMPNSGTEDENEEGKVNPNKGKDGDDGEETSVKGEYEGGIEGLQGLVEEDSRAAEIMKKGASFVPMLKNNVFLKMLVTKNTFGRTFVYSNVGKNDFKHGEFKISVIKPGRAKAAIVTVPKDLADIFANSDPHFLDKMSNDIMNASKNANLEEAGQKEMVDITVSFDNMSQYIAMLMEGKIGEYGGERGVMAYANKKRDKDGNVIDTMYDTEILNGKSHVVYTMKRPDQAVVGKKVKEGAASLTKAESNQINRYREGKTPLKRSSRSASPLYTPYNFVSTIKYDTANPFSDATTEEELREISSKANFQLSKEGATKPYYDDDKAIMEALEAGKPVPMFDKSAGAIDERYNELTHPLRKAIGNDGKPKMKPCVVSNDEYEANPSQYPDAKQRKDGSWTYKVPIEEGRNPVSSRIPVDFFTGEVIPVDGDIQFVKFTDPIQSAKDSTKSNMPRAKRYVVKAEGIDPKTDGRPEVSGTIGLSDEAYANAARLEISNDVLADALKIATTNSRGGSSSKAQDYGEAGLLYTLLNMRR